MKKSLAKKITLSILASAMLMTSSVAWAEGMGELILGDAADADGSYAVAIGNGANGKGADATGAYSIAIGNNSVVNSGNEDIYSGSIAIGKDSNALGKDNIAIGTGAKVGVGNNAGNNSVALGNYAQSTGHNSVALGYGSIANSHNVVSVGYGGPSGENTYFKKDENGVLVKVDSVEEADVWYPNTRSIINVTDVPDWKNTNRYGSYAVNVNTLNEAIASVQTDSVDLSGYYTKTETNSAITTAISGKANSADVYTKAQADSTFVKISNNAIDTPTSGFNVVNTDNVTKISVTHVGTYNSVVIDANEGITVGDNSTRMDSTGFYAGGAKPHNYQNSMAAITEDGKIKGAGGKFEVDESGNVTATNLYNKTDVDSKLDEKANATDVYKKTETYSQAEVNSKLDEKANASDVYKKAETYTKAEVDSMIGGSSDAINGINQRLDKTNAKINKVGAGAAALAALHPLEYDPDDKLTFSAGMGNYAGENAAALGAFYRPNEKFMVSLGGTMGNGENMVNLGLSIGLDKPNGFAKMSKRELIQEVNAVKAENNMLVQKVDAVEAENEAIKAEMAEMKALLQKIMAKK